MPEPLVDRVLGVVSRIAGPLRTPAAPGPDIPLAEGAFWLDSAGLFEVVLACEAEFDVRFDAEVDLFPDRLMTIATLTDTIRGHMRSRGLATTARDSTPAARSLSWASPSFAICRRQKGQ
jgi:acyl carrier protein